MLFIKITSVLIASFKDRRKIVRGTNIQIVSQICPNDHIMELVSVDYPELLGSNTSTV